MQSWVTGGSVATTARRRHLAPAYHFGDEARLLTEAAEGILRLAEALAAAQRDTRTAPTLCDNLDQLRADSQAVTEEECAA